MSSNINFNTTITSTSGSSPLSINNTGSRTDDIANQSAIDFSSSSGEQDELMITKGPWTAEVIKSLVTIILILFRRTPNWSC